MKTFFSLLGVFISVCLCGALIGFCTSFLYTHATLLIAGQPVSVISDGTPLFCFLVSLAVSAVFSYIFLVNYTIRHPRNVFGHIFGFIFITIIAWLIVIPFCVKTADETTSKIVQKETSLPSKKYFRPDTDGIFFYSAVHPEDNTADGLYIDLSGFSNSKSGVLRVEEAPINMQVARPFSDLLIKNTLTPPVIVKPLIPVLQIIADKTLEALKGGWKSWIAFSSIGLAFMSILGLRRLFRWRLLNSTVALLAFAGILLVNIIYFSGWDGIITTGVTIPMWLMNCIIACLFSFLGIILAITRPDPNLETN